MNALILSFLRTYTKSNNIFLVLDKDIKQSLFGRPIPKEDCLIAYEQNNKTYQWVWFSKLRNKVFIVDTKPCNILMSSVKSTKLQESK